MRLAVGLALVTALAAAGPQHRRREGEQQVMAKAKAAVTADTAGAATGVTTQGRHSPPPNKSEEVAPLLLDVVMQLVVDVARLAMELHRRGGSRLVTARRLNTPQALALLLTFQRPAEAAAASLKPKSPASEPTSRVTSLRARATDYESSAESTFSDPLPFIMKPLHPPVVPHAVPIALPMPHVAEHSSVVARNKQVHGEKDQRSRSDGRGRRQLKKGGEISERSGEVDGVSRIVAALMSGNNGYDISGLRLLFRLLEAIIRVLDAVKKLVVHWGGFRDGGGRGGGVNGAHSLGPQQKMESDITQDVAERVANMIADHEQLMGAHPANRADHKVPGR